MTWPDGFGTPLRLDGSARDAVTIEPNEPPAVVGLASMRVGIGGQRTIESITATPPVTGLEQLVGSRGGGHLRTALADAVPDERRRGTPLYLLLDDISGCSLIAGFAWSRWRDQWPGPEDTKPVRPSRESMDGVCFGFAPGTTAFTDADPDAPHVRVVEPLGHPDDPDGWHPLADLPPVSMRRARRIDAWHSTTDGTIRVDAGFQDSAGDPSGQRVAIHEYRLQATIDIASMMLTEVRADPRILPFLECPSAATSATAVEGTAVAELRETVLARLAKTAGCTHLNDALRALAEIPHLIDALDAELGGQRAARRP